MRIYQSIKLTSLLSLLAITFAGCLKDDDFEDGTIQSLHNSNGTNENAIEIQLNSADAENFLHTSFDASNKDTTVNFVPIVLASPGMAPQDIHVTVALDPTLVDEYNNDNGTAYSKPASNQYTIVNPVVTIPKGSRVGYVQIKLNPTNFIGDEWALGFTITKVDEAGYYLSGNLANGIVAFGIKNKYDGIYSLKIATQGWAAYSIMDDPTLKSYPGNFEVITAGASSVSLSNPNSGTLQPALTSGGSATAFGATTPLFTFNPATDAVTSVTNTTPDDGRGRALQLNTAIAGSKYDPATKTITAHYIMKQNGRPDQLIDVVFTYVRPR